LCNALTVFVESNRFRENDEQYSNQAVLKMPFPTSSGIELAEFALQGLRAIFKKGIGYKRAGVILMDFVPDNEYQRSLFFNSNPKHALLMKTVDTINTKFGQQKVRLATQDKKIHKMRQEKLSPNYTTRLKDIIEIKAAE